MIAISRITYLIGQNCRNFGLVSKILSDKNFCLSKNLSNILIQKSGKNRTKLSKFRLGVKSFVRRKFCPMFQYKTQAKIGQKCRNFCLVSKILSDEMFCPSKILSDELFSDKVFYEDLTRKWPVPKILSALATCPL